MTSNDILRHFKDSVPSLICFLLAEVPGFFSKNWKGGELRSETPRKFRPGDLAPVTGIYLVRHNPQHRPSHEAVIVRGETLPACRTCKLHITYEVLRTASHITHDWDFSGPSISVPQQDFANVRRLPRFNLRLPVVVQLARGPAMNFIHGVTETLGEGGMSAVLEGKLGEAQKDVSITLQAGTNGDPCVLQAHLRYRNGLHHGFEFIGVSSGQKKELRSLLQAGVKEQ